MSVYITSLVKPYVGRFCHRQDGADVQLSCTSLLIDNFLSNWDSVKGVFQMFKGSMGRMAIMLVDQYPKLSHVGVGLCNKVGGWVAGEVTENDRDLGRELILAVLLITVYLRSDHKPRTMDDHAEQGDYRYARMMMLAQILLAFSWIPYLSALAPYILHPLSLYWNISLQTILTFWAYAPYIALAVLAFAACSSDAEHHVYLARPGRFWEDPVLDWLNRRVNPTWDMQRRREYVVSFSLQPITYVATAYSPGTGHRGSGRLLAKIPSPLPRYPRSTRTLPSIALGWV